MLGLETTDYLSCIQMTSSSFAHCFQLFRLTRLLLLNHF